MNHCTSTCGTLRTVAIQFLTTPKPYSHSYSKKPTKILVEPSSKPVSLYLKALVYEPPPLRVHAESGRLDRTIFALHCRA